MTPPSTLADALDDSAGKAALTGIVDELAAVATSYELGDITERLRAVRDDLAAEELVVAVLGTFSAGKSTLLNVLLADTTTPVPGFGGAGVLPTGLLPTTAVLTQIRYAEQPHVVAHHHDGSSTPWELSRWRDDSDLSSDEADNHHRFGHIQSVEVGYPARLCAAGVRLLDTPGLGGHPARTTITRAAVSQCDAVILVTRGDILPGLEELDVLHALAGAGITVFVVINMVGVAEPDDRLREYLRLRFAESGAAVGHLYFVDAAGALAARLGQDLDGVRASGIEDFESELGRFLVGERVRARLAGFAARTGQIAADVEDSLNARRRVLREDHAALAAQRDRTDRLVAQLRSPDRDRRLTSLVGMSEQRTVEELMRSLHRTVNEIRSELPEHLERTKMPAERVVLGSSLLQKRLLTETAEEISRYTGERIERWGSTTAREIAAARFEELGAALETEVTDLAEALAQLHGPLTGGAAARDLPGLGRPLERVTASAAGTILADAGLAGTSGGFRVALVAGSGVAVTRIALQAVGVGAGLFFPVLLLAPIVAGVIVGNAGLGRRVKARAYLQADERLAVLPDQMAPVIRQQMRDQFEQTRHAVSVAMRDLITEGVALWAATDEADRQVYETRLTAALDAVADSRRRLHSMSTTISEGR